MITVAALSFAGCSVNRAESGRPAPSDPETSTTEPSATTPSAPAGDPADIEGIVVTEYPVSQHTLPDQRVKYVKAPPDGGRHDQSWANCMGAVYDKPVRNEHMVHSLEHGAVWIAYDAERVTGDDLDRLEDMVDGEPYLMLSPYPGLDQPIALQAWGHQLKLADVGDRRIDEFVRALRQNPETTPEPGASCDNPQFDVANPPPFETGPFPPDAVPVDGP